MSAGLASLFSAPLGAPAIVPLGAVIPAPLGAPAMVPPGALPGAVLVALLSAALFLAPTLALASWLPGSPLRRWTLAAALSGPALGATVLVLRAVGMTSGVAGGVCLAGWLVAAGLRLRALPAPPQGEEAQLLRRVAWLVPLVLLPPLVNPYLRVRSDAWFHAAVTAQVRNLPLPPQDAYYAGIPLQYFWFFHVVLSTFQAVAGLSPFVAMWLFNSVYFAATLAGAYLLSRRLGAPHGGALWTPWIVAAGSNAVGWIWIFMHGLRDPGHWAGLSRHLPDFAFDLTAWRFGGDLSFPLDKFLVGTAFSWGLCLFLLWALCVAECLDGGRRSSYVLAGALAAAAVTVHTVAGFAAFLWGAASVALTFLSAPSLVMLRRGLGVGLAMAAGLVLASPYLHLVTAHKSEGFLPQVGFNYTTFWATLCVGLVTLPLAALWAPDLWRSEGGARWALLLAASLIVSAWMLRMQFGNEDKFLNLAFLLVAAMAGPAARALLLRLFPARPRLRAGLAAALLAPVTAMLLICATVSRGAAPVHPDPPGPAPDELRLYDWVRHSTPASAVLLTRPPSLQALVRAERAQVWSESSYAVNWAYPPQVMEPRRRAVEDAFGPGLTESDLEFLYSLQRPVYRLSRAGLAPESAHFVEQHREGAWVVERLEFPEGK